jgi:ABC-2 type transport system permease protein
LFAIAGRSFQRYATCPVATWGGGFQTDFSERIRTGDIAIDLYRPTGFIPWWWPSPRGLDP